MAVSQLLNKYYAQVNASSSSSQDYVIPNGYKLTLSQFGGSAPQVNRSSVQVFWDPAGANELLFVTYADVANVPEDRTLVGDGSKAVRIMLINNDTSSKKMGGYFLGVLDG